MASITPGKLARPLATRLIAWRENPVFAARAVKEIRLSQQANRITDAKLDCTGRTDCLRLFIDERKLVGIPQKYNQKVSINANFSQRMRDFRNKTGLKQDELAKLLGISRNYVGMIENGQAASETLQKLFTLLESSPAYTGQAVRSQSQESSSGLLKEITNAVPYSGKNHIKIPVKSWAQAGIGTDFEEIPDEDQEYIYAAVNDRQAFAIQLRGDSMEPKYSDGDIAVLMPSTPARHGDLVVAKIKEEGHAFKIMNLVGGGPEKIKLTSYNPLYEPRILDREKFHWIYPVHSVHKLIRR